MALFVARVWPENPTGAWAFLLVGLAILLLVGSTWLVLATDLGARRGVWVVLTVVFGYLALHSALWMVSGNGPHVRIGQESFWNKRAEPLAILIGSLAMFALLLVTAHMRERQAEREMEED